MKKTAVIIAAGVLLFWLASASSGYEAIPFRNGGTIEGQIEFSGSVVPQDKKFTISSDVRDCGKEHRTEKYVINSNGRIKNVVVYLKDIKAGKPLPDENAMVVDSKCTFIPHVQVGFKGSKFVLKNEDTLLHTAHIYSHISNRTMFNIALPNKGSEITRTLSKTGIMELNCDCHPWMDGFVYISDQPYVAITDDNGSFVIRDIPPGVYTVEAWHESLGTRTLSNVTVQSGKTASIKLKFIGK